MNKKYLSAVVLLTMVFILTSCSAVQDRMVNESLDRGSIVLTLSRGKMVNTASTSTIYPEAAEAVAADSVQLMYSGHFDPEVDTDPTVLPRRVEDVLNKIEGYYIRIRNQSPDSDAMIDISEQIFFNPGESTRTLQIGLPVDESYQVTLLALGPGEKPLLLGAGSKSFVVTDGEDTSVTVPMLTYRYDIYAGEVFDGYDGQGYVPVNLLVIGPLLDDIFYGYYGQAECMLYTAEYYPGSVPEGDFNTQEYPQRDDGDDQYTFDGGYQARLYKFYISEQEFNQTEGGQYAIYIQGEMVIDDDWQNGEREMEFLLPAHSFEGFNSDYAPPYFPLTIAGPQ